MAVSRTRRDILKLAGAAPLAAVAARPSLAQSARVVVVGGGFGGATCARYLKRADPAIQVTLVEPASTFVTCPFSNAVLGGLRDLASITFDYTQLRDAHGVEVAQNKAAEIDPAARSVTLAGGQTLPYDRAGPVARHRLSLGCARGLRRGRRRAHAACLEGRAADRAAARAARSDG